MRRWCGAQGLALDAVLPANVSALLPNLQTVYVWDCALTPAARTTALDAACVGVRYIAFNGLAAAGAPAGAASASDAAFEQVAAAQLSQLAKLPNLSSVDLLQSSCPTLFLASLGAQLTRLQLHPSYRQCLPGTQTPTPGWRATLQHVARCTGLRDLTIPCQTAEELGVVAPALLQLHTLSLNGAPEFLTDGDAVVELLLGLPHLTSLHLGRCTWGALRHWYTDRPCRWQQLTLGVVDVEHLARLPLHSLTQPMQWQVVEVQPGTPERDVRAAVANATQRCPAGFRWAKPDGSPPELWFVDGAGGGALRALRPLLAPLAAVQVGATSWDAEWVKLLGEALPRTCAHLALYGGVMPRAALEQAVCSLPWVERLQAVEQLVAPEDVVELMRLTRGPGAVEGGGGAGPARLKEVVVTRPERPGGMREADHRAVWERTARVVREEQREAGQFGSGHVVVLEVEW